jgi:hypothetical protein
VQASVPILICNLLPHPLQPWPLFGIHSRRTGSYSLRIGYKTTIIYKPVITLVLAFLHSFDQVLLFIASPVSAAQNWPTHTAHRHHRPNQSAITLNNLVDSRQARYPSLQVNILEIYLNICPSSRSPRVLKVIRQVLAIILYNKRKVNSMIPTMHTGKSIIRPEPLVFRQTVYKRHSSVLIF